MDLRLTEDQEMLKKVAADFVKAEVPAHQMTQWYKNKQTFQPQLMKKAAELGWLGMMLPEEYGGAGRHDHGLRRGFRGAGARTGAGAALHFGRAQRPDNFRSLHPTTKNRLAAAPVQRRDDRRSRPYG